MTIDTIVQKVTDQLTKPGPGKDQVERMDKLVESLNDQDLRRARALLRARPGISFSVNTTQAGRNRPTISVRVQGVDCGFVIFEPAARVRTFNPSKKFIDLWKSDKPTLEWADAAVARFVAACGSRAAREYAHRESSIQELLFHAMKGDGSKKTQFRHFQPVLFGGVPFQFPLPVTPRGKPGGLGKQKGHSDVLARTRKRGQVVVFEVKAPGAGLKECEGALEQAVTYAASLAYLMGREENRPHYWRLLGTSRGPLDKPSFSAVAFLDAETAGQRYEGALRRKLAELGNSRGYELSVMLYRRLGNRIEVEREIR